MDKLLNLLKSIGIPVEYNHFNNPPNPPYIIYLFTNSLNLGADNKVYKKINNYQVELYSIKKDLVSENLIEDLFYINDIYYEKTEDYIDSEGLYEVLYEIEY